MTSTKRLLVVLLFVFLIGDVANDSERIIKDVFLDGKIKNVSFEKRYSHFCVKKY
ncbi:MAG: hypothetical protein L6V91_02720 [Bacilli bacterium]|nr:MAG: hypothetical protein L6V91_02720 [Bacilli bacterium]